MPHPIFEDTIKVYAGELTQDMLALRYGIKPEQVAACFATTSTPRETTQKILLVSIEFYPDYIKYQTKH